MAVISIVALCSLPLVCCWSAQNRCYVARRDQVLMRVAQILGNERLAFEWMTRPALGLNRRTPMSILADPDGYAQVQDHLLRIEHGVY